MTERFALIVGAMKSGTTSLFSHLSQHPQVAPSRVKETDFFCSELYERGPAYYRGLFPFRPGMHRVALEASPGYTMRRRHPEVVDRIASFDGDFRFIYVVRDPLERIESHYRHLAKKGALPSTREPEEVPEEILDVSRYAAQIAPYCRRFGRERVLLVAFEDLVAHPAAELRRTCGFLGLAPDHGFKGLDAALNRGVVDHPLVRWLESVPAAVEVARLVPARLKQRLRDRLASRRRLGAPLPRALRARCLEALADDLARLRDELGFDTSRWRLAP